MYTNKTILATGIGNLRDNYQCVVVLPPPPATDERILEDVFTLIDVFRKIRYIFIYSISKTKPDHNNRVSDGEKNCLLLNDTIIYSSLVPVINFPRTHFTRTLKLLRIVDHIATVNRKVNNAFSLNIILLFQEFVIILGSQTLFKLCLKRYV